MFYEFDGPRENNPDNSDVDRESLYDILEQYQSDEDTDLELSASLQWSEDEVSSLCVLHDRVETGADDVTEFPYVEVETPLEDFTGEQQMLYLSLRALVRERRARGDSPAQVEATIAQEGRQLASDVYLQALIEIKERFPNGERPNLLDNPENQLGLN